MDWVDEEANRRAQGLTRPLSQTAHAAVNSRYPGATLEYCCKCGSATGRAGAGEDSLYIGDDGPFCEECHREDETA